MKEEINHIKLDLCLGDFSPQNTNSITIIKIGRYRGHPNLAKELFS